MRFECGKNTTNIRVDAAVIHCLLEAPLGAGRVTAAHSVAGTHETTPAEAARPPDADVDEL